MDDGAERHRALVVVLLVSGVGTSCLGQDELLRRHPISDSLNVNLVAASAGRLNLTWDEHELATDGWQEAERVASERVIRNRLRSVGSERAVVTHFLDGTLRLLRAGSERLAVAQTSPVPAPSSLLVDSTSLWVPSLLGEIFRFRIGIDTLVLSGVLSPPLVVRDLCSHQGNVFAVGSAGPHDGTIFQMDRSFAEARPVYHFYRSRHPVISVSLNDGFLLCRADGTLVFLSTRLPYLVLIDLSAPDRASALRIPGSHLGLIVDLGSGRMRSGILSDTLSHSLGLFPYDDLVIVQSYVIDRSRLIAGDPGWIRTVVLDPEERRWSAPGDSIGRLLGPLVSGIVGHHRGTGGAIVRWTIARD